jgi:hypothetical protein
MGKGKFSRALEVFFVLLTPLLRFFSVLATALSLTTTRIPAPTVLVRSWRTVDTPATVEADVGATTSTTAGPCALGGVEAAAGRGERAEATMSLDVRAVWESPRAGPSHEPDALRGTGIDDGIASSPNSSRLFFLNEIVTSRLQRALHSTASPLVGWKESPASHGARMSSESSAPR